MSKDGGEGRRMPALFIGHGSPMNAIEDNDYTRSLVRLGLDLPHPEAIMVISAHWLTKGSFVSCQESPRTIHDFSGFPMPLYGIQYPAAGSPVHARITSELSHGKIGCDLKWGLDHASWAVLRHIWPEADVPVYEMSLDYDPGTYEKRQIGYHYDLARGISGIRDRGVMVLGSGNAVHNLRLIDFQHRDGEPFGWAKEFDHDLKEKLVSGDHDGLIELDSMPGAELAAPILDHYLPMIYVLGMMREDETLRFVHEGFQNRSVSMRSFIIE